MCKKGLLRFPKNEKPQKPSSNDEGRQEKIYVPYDEGMIALQQANDVPVETEWGMMLVQCD